MRTALDIALAAFLVAGWGLLVQLLVIDTIRVYLRRRKAPKHMGHVQVGRRLP